MKPEQQRIAIAQACGWKYLWDTEYQGWRGDNPDGSGDAFLPDYPNDLNACHEMEAHLSSVIDTDGSLMIAYTRYLTQAMAPSGWPIWYATAKHRSEAFLRTIGKRVDE